MKKSILLMLAVCCCAGVAGADNFEQVLKSRFENREASSAKGDNDVFVYGNHIEWRNGSTRCSKVSIMGEDDVVEQIGFQLDDVEDWDRRAGRRARRHGRSLRQQESQGHHREA